MGLGWISTLNPGGMSGQQNRTREDASWTSGTNNLAPSNHQKVSPFSADAMIHATLLISVLGLLSTGNGKTPHY